MHVLVQLLVLLLLRPLRPACRLHGTLHVHHLRLLHCVRELLLLLWPADTWLHEHHHLLLLLLIALLLLRASMLPLPCCCCCWRWGELRVLLLLVLRCHRCR
jgi:hypothetical protein